MKTFLMYRDRDPDMEQPLPWNADDLSRDLGLSHLTAAMVGSDRFLPEVVPRSLLCGLAERDAVRYRQAVLRDCIANAHVVRTLYALACTAVDEESRNFWGLRSRHAASILRRSNEVLKMFVNVLVQIRTVTERSAASFTSDGFTRFFSMLRTELDDDYLLRIREYLRRMEFHRGMLMSAKLGIGNRGVGFVPRDYDPPLLRWFERFFPPKEVGYTYALPPRDESGMRALSELEDRGINIVANALGQSADHMLAFFTTLRYELGFYVASLNLHDALLAKGQEVCFPTPSQHARRFAGLYDAGLALTSKDRVVGNDCDADERPMFVITGANRGGKSTFLRSLGLAQLMMECGMFVPATSYEAPMSTGLYTHFKREEDPDMQSGKFDEELRRMDALAERLHPRALVLFNESFAATNDREGSEIARQISEALIDSGVSVAFVTHLYEFAHHMWDERGAQCTFLRANRLGDGRRTFRLDVGEPLPTSHGEDIYRRVFGQPVNEQTQSLSAGKGT